MLGGGTEEVSKELREQRDDRRYIAMLGSKTRDRIRATEMTFDVAVVDEGTPSNDPSELPKPPKPEPKKPEEPQKPLEQKKPEPPKQEVKVVTKGNEPPPKYDAVPLQPEKRIAVKQHAAKNQPDNPNAKFIANEANKVEQESVATQTAHDQDDENPTPGANKPGGPKDHTGDSDRTKIADSDEHKGEANRAPGEKGTEFDIQKDPRPLEKPAGAAVANLPAAHAPPKAGGDGRQPQSPATAAAPPALVPGTPAAPSPDGASGTWSFNPIVPGARASNTSDPVPGTTNQNRPMPEARNHTKWLGLGGKPGPGQVNLNLSQSGVVAVVGSDELRKEREADGERRRSEHRGSWSASNFERWRNAIENYVSSVKPGNQTALNTAAVPFATYLNSIHNRIHPIFADSFLGSLDNLPKNHPMNDMKLLTRLEIVVSPKNGRVVKMGIVKTSGITAFDIAALDSVNRAQPFGPAPSAIISADGNVYLHWEFHRDEVFACTTANARPFMLNTPAKSPSPDSPPPAPSPARPSRERGAPPPVNIHEMREGSATSTHAHG